MVKNQTHMKLAMKIFNMIGKEKAISQVDVVCALEVVRLAVIERIVDVELEEMLKSSKNYNVITKD